jgi:hypothetical protein
MDEIDELNNGVVARVAADDCETLAEYLRPIAGDEEISNEYVHMLETLYHRIGVMLQALRLMAARVNQARTRRRRRTTVRRQPRRRTVRRRGPQRRTQ